jgi:hypothetical protein
VLDVTRARLNRALRTAHTLTALRAEVIQLSSELEDAERHDRAPDTQRAPPEYPECLWGEAAAPSTQRGSELGREFGA